MHWDKKGSGLDPMLGQVGPQLIAGHTKLIFYQNRVHPEHVFGPVRFRRRHDTGNVFEKVGVKGGIPTAVVDKIVQLFGLGQANCGL